MAKIRMYIQSHGHFENDAVLNLAGANMATADNKNPTAHWKTDIPSLTVLINHSDVGWILYDTTSHPDNLKGHWPERLQKLCPHYLEPEDTLAAKLKILNLTPADIDILILSHLHIDHAGNLFLFRDSKAGHNVYVHEKELKEALFLTHVGLEKDVGPYVRDDFVMDGIAYNPVDENFQLAEGIDIITLEGDAPGILGMVVHLENSGVFIFTSDGIKTKENYGPPPQLPGVIYDSLGFFRSVAKIKRLEQQYRANIVFGHDGNHLKQFKLSPEFYD